MRPTGTSGPIFLRSSILAISAFLIACSSPAGTILSQSIVAEDTDGSAIEKAWRSDVVAVQFTSLDGPIVLNRSYVGDIQSISIVGASGLATDGDPDDLITSKRNGPLTLSLPSGQRANRIEVTGTNGSIILSLATASVAAPPDVLWPIDGMIDIRSGGLTETIQLASGAVHMDRLAAEHRVTIGGSRTDVIAMRDREIAVAGDSIDLTPQGTDVRITSPGGVVTRGEVPAWGYKVYMQPVTDLNAWVPIFAQVTGLFPDEIVTMRFTAVGNQRIEPRMVTITGVQAQDGMTVAHFLTQSEGNQSFDVEVQRNFAPAE